MKNNIEISTFSDNLILTEISFENSTSWKIKDLLSILFEVNKFEAFAFDFIKSIHSNSISEYKNQKLLREQYPNETLIHGKANRDNFEYVVNISNLKIGDFISKIGTRWIIVCPKNDIDEKLDKLLDFSRQSRDLSLEKNVKNLLEIANHCARVWTWEHIPIVQIFSKNKFDGLEFNSPHQF